MNPRILLIAITLTTITAAAADARAPNTSLHFAPPIDAAAIPAYPSASMMVSRGAVRHRQSHPSAGNRRTPPAPRQAETGTGIVRSAKTGATARVAPAHRAAFQAYVDDLEAAGAVVRFMGGYRKGPCWSGGLHPCGKALDVCQMARGRVDSRCHLPGRVAMIAIAARHGLTEGGIWCHQDRGHAQVGMTSGPCGRNLYAAVGEFHARSRQ